METKQATNTKPQGRKKEMEAFVVGDKMQKTIVVQIKSRVQHPVFKKYYTVSKKYKAHDEKNEAKIGDRVLIRQSRPLSAEKRWVVVKILEKGAVELPVKRYPKTVKRFTKNQRA